MTEQRKKPSELPSGTSPARYALIHVAAAATGLSEKAIRRKIENGTWLRGVHYRKAPDGHIFIDMVAFERVGGVVAIV